MLRYALRRLLHSVVVIFGIITLVFLVLRLLPGDAAYVLAGPTATQEQVDALREQLGTSRPVYVQYGIFLRHLAEGDLGDSVYYTNESAINLVLDRMPATLILAIPSLILAVFLAFTLGIVSALKRGTWIDDVLSTLALVGQAAPSFWIGPLLIIVFAVNLGWLPTSGRGGVSHLVLPVFTLTLPLFALSMRLVRSGMLDTLNKEYVLTARAKGLRESAVLRNHVLRNTLIPVVTYIGLQLGNLLSGAVVIEIVFAWPGVGRLLVDSIVNRDYAVVQASVILLSTLFVLVNLAVDLLYGFIDPRVDYS
jgi:ABC-type dipeptide/oligopeptide/nickel transport system permease component